MTSFRMAVQNVSVQSTHHAFRAQASRSTVTVLLKKRRDQDEDVPTFPEQPATCPRPEPRGPHGPGGGEPDAGNQDECDPDTHGSGGGEP